MKYLFLSLALSLSFTTTAFAKDKSKTLVTCQLQDFSACESCQDRIRAACANQEYIGSLDLSLKPSKLEWQVTNAKNGTEKRVLVNNKTLSLKDLKKARNLKTLAAKQKIKITSEESVTLVQIQIPLQTKIYKNTQGTELLAEMKPPRATRAIASIDEVQVTKGVFAGGVKRAQTLKEKK